MIEKSSNAPEGGLCHWHVVFERQYSNTDLEEQDTEILPVVKVGSSNTELKEVVGKISTGTDTSQIHGTYTIPEGSSDIVVTADAGAVSIFIDKSTEDDRSRFLVIDSQGVAPYIIDPDGWSTVDIPPYPLESVSLTGQVRAVGVEIGDKFVVTWGDVEDPDQDNQFALGEIFFAYGGRGGSDGVGYYQMNWIQGVQRLINDKTELTFSKIL